MPQARVRSLAVALVLVLLVVGALRVEAVPIGPILDGGLVRLIERVVPPSVRGLLQRNAPRPPQTQSQKPKCSGAIDPSGHCG